MEQGLIIDNMFGMVRGKYIGEPPLYVDKSLPPGMTDLPKPTIKSWLRNIPTILIATPNFIWVVISLGVYANAPYNLGLSYLVWPYVWLLLILAPSSSLF